MKTLKFVFLMAVFMMIAIATTSSVSVKMANENSFTTATVLPANDTALSACLQAVSSNVTMTARELMPVSELGQTANIAKIETAKAEVSEAKGKSELVMHESVFKKVNVTSAANLTVTMNFADQTQVAMRVSPAMMDVHNTLITVDAAYYTSTSTATMPTLICASEAAVVNVITTTGTISYV